MTNPNVNNGFFRLLEAIIDGAAAASDMAKRRQPPPAGPMRGQPPMPPAQKPGCGGCGTGKKR
jgi:hypothetical protein